MAAICQHVLETKSRRTIIVDSMVFWGEDFRKRIAEYIMPLYPPFWRLFMQNGGHLQSNSYGPTSISETKRSRAFDFDSMSRFCGACISEKAIASTILEAI